MLRKFVIKVIGNAFDSALYAKQLAHRLQPALLTEITCSLQLILSYTGATFQITGESQSSVTSIHSTCIADF